MRKRILFKEEEVARDIELYIEEKRLSEGSRLPSERLLAEKYGVQRETIRSALRVLLGKGVVIKKPRQGYFVAPRKIALNLGDFRSVLKELERVGGENRSELIGFEMTVMSKSLSDITEMPEGTMCWQLLRVRYDRERPTSVERSYITAEYAPDLTRDDVEGRDKEPLQGNRFDITLASVRQRITQVYGGAMETELLKVKRDTPLLRYEGLVYDAEGRLIEYFDNLIIPDGIEFSINDCEER